MRNTILGFCLLAAGCAGSDPSSPRLGASVKEHLKQLQLEIVGLNDVDQIESAVQRSYVASRTSSCQST